METKTYKVKRINNPLNGSVTLSLSENWGPVITEENIEKAKDKFIKALRVALIVKCFNVVNDIVNKESILKDEIKSAAESTKITDKNIELDGVSA